MGDVVGDSDNEWDAFNFLEIERDLREQLKLVKLIGELEIGPADEIYMQAKSVVARFAKNGNLAKVASVAPCSLCIFLVGEGAFNYSSGAYWDQLSIGPIESPGLQRQLGEAFLKTITSIGLEDFSYVLEEEHAFRFVAPILLHGGVPRNSAGDLWRLLLNAVNDGLDESDQILASWRSTHTRMQTLDKPVRRFLDYGGVFASDLLERMVDLVDYVGTLGRDNALRRGALELSQYAGLPAYLAEQLLTVDIQTPRRRLLVARPRLFIDAYSGEGPTLALPAVAAATERTRWTMRPSSVQRIFKASRFDVRTVVLTPESMWEVSLEGIDTPKTWRFGGVEGLRLFFFDAKTFELLRDQERIKSDSVIALSPKSVQFHSGLDREQPLPEGDELPNLSGQWTGWRLRVLALNSHRNFVASQDQLDGSLTSRTIAVQSTTAAAGIASKPIDGIIDVNGWPVFNGPPSIHVPLHVAPIEAWNVRFSSVTGEIVEQRLANLPHTDEIFDITGLFRDQVIASGEIVVRGPLGSDLRASLSIVNQLRITRPTSIIDPYHEVTVDLTAEVPIFPAGALTHSVHFAEGVAHQSLVLDDGNDQLTVSISIPRLLWFLRRSDAPQRTLSGLPFAVGLDDINSQKVDALVIHTGQESIAELRLLAGDQVLQRSDVVRISPEAGRWSFPISPFATSIAQSGKNHLVFELEVDGITVRPLTVFARFEVTDLRLETLLDAAEGSTLLHCQWKENRSFLDREVRVWSLTRPWEGPYRFSVSDNSIGEMEVLIGNHEVPAGPYLLEVGIRDPWLESLRPTAMTANTQRVTVGSSNQFQEYLKKKRGGGPLATLEQFVSEPNAGISTIALRESIEGIEVELAHTLLSLLAEKGNAFASDRIVDGILQAVCGDARILGNTIVEISRVSIDQDAATKVVIAALPYLFSTPCCPRSEDDLLVVWRSSLLAGAAIDNFRELGAPSVDRWTYFTGWSPDDGTMPFSGGPIPIQFTEKTKAELEELTLAIQAGDILPLQGGGFVEAAFEILANASESDGSDIAHWRTKHSSFNDARINRPDDIDAYLRSLGPLPNAPRWTVFSQDLLATVIHLLYIPNSRVRATRALWDALPLARKMIERNVLLVQALEIAER